MKSIDVFISSSQWELENEREIAKETIDNLGLHGDLFEMYPALNKSPESGFLELVEKCDIYVLIVWKRFSEAVQKEYQKAVEKNKPILLLVKKALPGEDRDDELKNFIEINYHGGSHHKMRITKHGEFRKLNELKALLTESIKEYVNNILSVPFTALTLEQMYDKGTEIIMNSQKRLYMFQKTPTLFLGLKNREENTYLKGGEEYEKRFLDSLTQWIEKHHVINDVKFRYLFDLEKTKKELDEIKDEERRNELKMLFIERFKYYSKIQERNKNFKFDIIDKPISGPLIVGDNIYGIWVTGELSIFAYSQENHNISEGYADMVESHFLKAKSVNKIIEYLG